MEADMTWLEKLEIGWQGNAPYRKDNLPLTEVIGTELLRATGNSDRRNSVRAGADRVCGDGPL
jgi:hypothetical protein